MTRNSVIKKGGPIFYFLFFIFLSQESLACLDLPDQIRLSGSTFLEEKIIIDTAPNTHNYKHKIRFGGNALWHDGSCWIFEDKKGKQQGCLSAITGGNTASITNKHGKKIGVLLIADSRLKLWVYSVDSSGNKDEFGQPFLSFHEEVILSKDKLTESNQRSILTVKAYGPVNGQVHMIGEYSSQKDDSPNYSKGLTLERDPAKSSSKNHVFNISGQRGVSKGCDGITTQNL